MSFLRSVNVIRNGLSELRFGTNTRLRVDHLLLFKTHPSLNHARCIVSSRSIPKGTIDQTIERLDKDVRRVGRISGRELLEVFNDIKSTGRATSTQSLFLIRCCGHFVPEETPESRNKLVSEIWDTLEKLGVKLDVSHYNALLSVYIENEFNFSPVDFLSKLEAKGIEPNRVTYQRLVASCCQNADIGMATEILQVMKDKQIPINETIFNSLIIGHSNANDMESALGILSVMKQAGLQPTSETYRALLCGYAKQGDMEAIEQKMNECVQNELDLTDRDILEVVYNLGANGHHEHLEKMIEKTKKTPGFRADIENICLRLISHGYISAALQVFKSTLGSPSDKAPVLQRGNILIRQAVKSNLPTEKLLELCEDMKTSGYNQYSYHVAAETSMLNQNPELSLLLLSSLAKHDDLCQHYFWPVLVEFGKNKNFEGVIKTLKLMQTLLNQPLSGETLKDYVIPYLNENGAVEKLRKAGIPLATTASAMVGHLLSKNRMENAVKIALKYRSNYNSVGNRRSLTSAFFQTGDVSSLATLAQVFAEGDDEGSSGQLLLTIFKKDATVVENVLKAFLEGGVGLTAEHAEAIKELLGDKLTPESSEILTTLSSPNFARGTIKRYPLVRRVVPEKDEETMLNDIAALEAKGESTATLKRHLLVHYCQQKLVDKAVALQKELERDNVELQPGLHALMMELHCSVDDVDEAMNYYGKIKSREGTRLDPVKAIKLALLLCSNDKFQDALEIINSHPQTNDDGVDGSSSHLSPCWRLLNTCAEKKNPEILKKIFDALLSNNFIEPTNILLGPLIKVHLLREDVEGALTQFEECCVKYRATPWKNELACKLIEKEDAAALQKLADLSTQIHGEVNSLYDLVLSFVECKKIKQAKKILETPGLRTRTQRISAACQRYLNNGDLEHLQTLFDVTRDFSHINRSEIAYYLMLSYAKIGEVDKATALWTQMQEEDLKPSDEFLVQLGKLLKEHNRPVPFEIPTEYVPEQKGVYGKSPVTPLIKQYRKALYAKELDEALELRNQLNESELSKADLSRLVSLMVFNGRIGEASKLVIEWLEKGLRPDLNALNYMINSIAKLGDVDVITSIGSLLNPELKRMVSYNNRYAHCMVEAGRGDELVEGLRQSVLAAKTPEEIEALSEDFPRGGIYSVFEDNPELIPKIEELAQLYLEKGVLDPTNSLWVHYVVTGDKVKAEDYWIKLAPSSRLMFMPILRKARNDLDLSLAEDLLGRCKSIGMQTNALGLVYSSIIDILITKDNLDEAEKRLEEALNTITIEDLNRLVLQKLKNNIELAGKSFKFNIPPKRARAANQDSSSSSDSDSEETKAAGQHRA